MRVFPSIVFGFGRIVEKRYQARLELGAHSHPHTVLSLVLAGSFEERHGRMLHHRRPGPMRLWPAGREHSNRYGASGARSCLIELAPETLPINLERCVTGAGAFFAEASEPTLVAHQMRRELGCADDVSPLALEGLLLQLLGAILRSRRIRESRIPAWLKMTRDRLSDAARTASVPLLGTIARDCGVHPAHLSRAFRATYGCSPSEYVLRVRIAWAQERLRTTGDPISRVAVEAGFYDESHFSRRFRTHVGCAPGAFRASLSPQGRRQ